MTGAATNGAAGPVRPEPGPDPAPGHVPEDVADVGDVVSWRALLAQTAARLRAAGVDNATQEARWLVERATGCTPAELAVSLDRPATERGATHLDAMVTRREAGEPLQYALGRWAFRSLELFVDQRVLIPRPETEALAEMTLDECRRLDASVAADLGTGSGALALAMAKERTGLEVWGTDVSSDALAVARANLAGLGRAATRVRLAEGSWFDALPDDLAGRIDVIVANPPYVADDEIVDLPAEVRDWEPHVALFSGPSGMEDVTHIVAHAPTWLARPGTLLVEMAPHQTREAQRLARAAGFASVTVWPDLTGRDRILLARL